MRIVKRSDVVFFLAVVSFIAHGLQAQGISGGGSDGWTTVFYYDFEDDGLSPVWLADKGEGDYYWGISDWNSVSGSRCAWCAAQNSSGYPDIDPENGPYANNMNTVLFLNNPVDLRFCSNARLSFNTAFWTEYGQDWLEIYAVSDNKQAIFVDWLTGRSPYKDGTEWQQWQEKVYYFASSSSLIKLLGQSSVSLLFFFNSDGDNNTSTHRLRGVFIDDVKVETYSMLSPVDDVDVRPHSFSLGQNFPNPFNPETMIRYSVPQPADVTIRVFNSLGKQVRTLVDGYVQAGTHQVVWDGRDRNGNKVVTGIYYYAMESDGFRSLKKAVFLK